MKKENLILILCGMNLMLLQFLMLREFIMILTGITFVIALLGVSFFLGFSVGYAISNRLSPRAVQVGLLTLFLVHLTLPFSPRWLAGLLAAWNVRQYTLLAMMFIAAFLMSTVYSIFLPRIIGSESSGDNLARCYSLELLGSMLGLGAVALSMRQGHLFALMLLYLVVFFIVVGLLIPRRGVLAVLAVMIVGYAILFPRLDRSSLEYFYRHARHFTVARSLYSVHSPYQKVDVIESRRGDRFLYLNGLLDFDSTQLEAFNFFLSELPARLQRESRVLIVGSGSMSSVSHVAPYSTSIQTVELDAAVAEAGRKFFARYNRLGEIKHWRLTIDDAKHFLGAHPREKYDLVVMDVPAPATVQEALLHSKEFYALVRRHLTERGIISVSLSGRFQPGNPTPLAVAAGLMAVFPESYVVTSSSAGRSFAIAGRHLQFTREDIQNILQQRPQENFAIFNRAAMNEIAGEATPISQEGMNSVLHNGLRRVGWMYFPTLMKGM